MTACLLDELDIALVKGDNDPPVIWQFLTSENPDVLFPIDGSTFRLEVTWDGGGFVLQTPHVELQLDLVQSLLLWRYTIERTEPMPAGRVSQYELRRIVGTEIRSLATGFVDVED